MTKDRLTQLVALLIALLALGGSALLINPVNRQRQDLQLTFAVESNQGDPPQYVLLAQGLGSFRGVAVNALWYRVEMLKRDGKFAEANTLSTWITNLQPRFPQVWGFLAWNMAYNISVETFTPQERYDWVNKGVKLLREQGIPYNPNAVRLYRELSWIYFHKIGQFTDDVNWYYKGEMAREWEVLLGAAPEYYDAPGVLGSFEPVAIMADRYFAIDEPAYNVKDALGKVIDNNAVPALTQDKDRIQKMGIVALQKQLQRLRKETKPDNTRAVQVLDALLALVDDQLSRAERDASSVFLEENPKAAVLADQLRSELGMGLDGDTMRAIGTCLMYLRFRSAQDMMEMGRGLLGPDGVKVMPLVFGWINAPRDSDTSIGYRQLLAFLRAKTLIEDYKMQPTVMYEYMTRYGPLDWRHPNTHSLYWAQLGVEQYEDNRDKEKIDLLNTKRQAIHSLQSLSHFGTVSFNPLAPPGYQIDLLPDPDMIDGYLLCIDEAQEQADADEFARIKADAFAAGEENFLQFAVLNTYLYGSEAKANQYFDRLKEEFGDSAQNRQYGWYKLSLGDFVAHLVFSDDLGRSGMISLINAKLTLAFRSGLANRREQVFARNIQLAESVHKLYNEKYGNETALDVGGGRMRLPEFDQMVFDAFTQFMQNRAIDIYTRLSAYAAAYQAAAAGMPIAPQTYYRWSKAVADEITPMGINPQDAIPAPPNAVQPKIDPNQQQGGQTIERQ